MYIYFSEVKSKRVICNIENHVELLSVAAWARGKLTPSDQLLKSRITTRMLVLWKFFAKRVETLA